jgi:M6 family metalloprotease-like protein
MKRTSFYLITMLFMLAFPQAEYAEPANPDAVQYKLPDGSFISITLKGDEYVSWAVSPDGYTLLTNEEGYYEYAQKNNDGNLVLSGIRAHNPEERSDQETELLNNTPKDLRYSAEQISAMRAAFDPSFNLRSATQTTAAMPTTGTVKAPLILIGFQGKEFTIEKEKFESLVNGVGYTADGTITGSVHDYYSDNSYGELDYQVDVLGPYTLSKTIDKYDYKTTSGGNQTMVLEALKAANDAGCDFSLYDNDNDGKVDGVHIIFAGYSQAAGAPQGQSIWSHAGDVGSPPTYDEKTIPRYSCSPELRGNSGTNIANIGTIAHELGHVFGLPDLYDADYENSGGESVHIGTWDIMATGLQNDGGRTPANFSAYCKNILGWKPATVLETSQNILLQNPEIEDVTYRIDTKTTNEYFLLENRQKTGWDAYIPASGMLIYHVDKTVESDWTNNKVNVNPARRRLYIKQAGGGDGSTGTSRATDPYPSGGNTAFTDDSSPDSKSWAGANTGGPVTNIVHHTSNRSVSFAFMGGVTNQYLIQAGTNSSNGGTVTGEKSGYYAAGTEVTFTATPADGYYFSKWKDGNNAEKSTDATYTFNVTADVALVAEFIPEGAITISSRADLLEKIRNEYINNTNSNNRTAAGISFVQVADIDMSTASNDWLPIGTDTYPFCGKYDGGGYKIENLKTNAGYGGLFGVVDGGAVIENVHIASGSISNTGGVSYQGAIVSSIILKNKGDVIIRKNINNASVATDATGNYPVASGIVGYISVATSVDDIGDVFIEQNTNTGSITGSGTNTRSAGIVGHINTQYNNVTIRQNINAGSVEGSGINTSGVVGYASSTGSGSIIVEENTNEAIVTGNGTYTGGIVGQTNAASNISVEQNTNSGDISGNYTGGTVGGVNFAGASGKTTVKQNTNTGKVIGTESTSRTGGILGFTNFNNGNISLELNENAGEVIGNGHSTGGIVGYALSNSSKSLPVKQNTNTGSVAGTGSSTYTGGIVGYLYSALSGGGDVELNTNTGNVAGSGTSTGGIVGYIYLLTTANTVTVTQNTNTGNVTGDGLKTGGIVGHAYNNIADGIINIISNYNDGDVTGTAKVATNSSDGSINIGGIVGYARSTAKTITISNNFSHAKIESILDNVTPYIRLGGIAGFMQATVTGGIISFEANFAGGSILADNLSNTNLRTGGLVGMIYRNESNDVSFKNSVVAQTLIQRNGSNGHRIYGAILGSSTNFTSENNYAYEDMIVGTGKASSNSTNEGANLPFADLFKRATYNSWFGAGNPWQIVDGHTYPYLTKSSESPDETAVNGHIRVVKTVESKKWYSMGFPFDVANVYSETHGFLSAWDTADGDYWLKTYNPAGGTEEDGGFEYADLIEAGQGYIIQFPEALTDKVVTFISELSPKLKSGVSEDDLAVETDYSFVANPLTGELPLAPQRGYYVYDQSENRFLRLESNDYTLSPFEGVIVLTRNFSEGSFRSAIGTDGSNGATGEELIPTDANDPVIATRYYNLQGIEISRPLERNFYIVRQIHQSGKEETKKIIDKK